MGSGRLGYAQVRRNVGHRPAMREPGLLRMSRRGVAVDGRVLPGERSTTAAAAAVRARVQRRAVDGEAHRGRVTIHGLVLVVRRALGGRVRRRMGLERFFLGAVHQPHVEIFQDVQLGLFVPQLFLQRTHQLFERFSLLLGHFLRQASFE